jgi:hypothetical protein
MMFGESNLGIGMKDDTIKKRTIIKARKRKGFRKIRVNDGLCREDY